MNTKLIMAILTLGLMPVVAFGDSKGATPLRSETGTDTCNIPGVGSRHYTAELGVVLGDSTASGSIDRVKVDGTNASSGSTLAKGTLFVQRGGGDWNVVGTGKDHKIDFKNGQWIDIRETIGTLGLGPQDAAAISVEFIFGYKSCKAALFVKNAGPKGELTVVPESEVKGWPDRIVDKKNSNEGK